MLGILPDRYNRENLFRIVRDPTLFLAEARNIRRSVARIYQNIVFRLTHGKPFDIMAEEWDSLIILDACRDDFYREQTPFSEPVETRLSRGSETPEFFENNFDGTQYHDTVYISPNPYIPTLEDNTFHAVVPLLDEWDDEWGTVHPKAVSEAARKARAEYPEKRLIIHYMQPHAPHTGSTARELRETTPLQGWDRYHVVDGQSEINDGVSIWTLAKRGDITLETLRQSYRETLDIVLEDVADLVTGLDGRTVVTADHGEMLGERLIPFGPREYAHTYGLLTEQLRCVPWQVVSDADRREVSSDPPRERQEMTTEETERRLRALGYAE